MLRRGFTRDPLHEEPLTEQHLTGKAHRNPDHLFGNLHSFSLYLSRERPSSERQRTAHQPHYAE